VREILESADRQVTQPTVHEAQKYFDSFSRKDYATAIRKHYDRGQLRKLLAEMQRMLPALNQQVFRTTDPRRLGKIASDLGVMLHVDRFDGFEGRSLRGFYLDDTELLNRPSIWVNTANHPVGVAAAFWHEEGHHLTKQISDSDDHRVQYSFKSNHQNHLADASEIAADMVMVLACYPKAAAKTLFAGERHSGRRKKTSITWLALFISQNYGRPYFRNTKYDKENTRFGNSGRTRLPAADAASSGRNGRGQGQPYRLYRKRVS
jgi:hypothetical protein